MKFINYLEKISGVSIYPVISLLLFTAVFVLVIIYAMRVSRTTIAEMENIPSTINKSNCDEKITTHKDNNVTHPFLSYGFNSVNGAGASFCNRLFVFHT